MGEHFLCHLRILSSFEFYGKEIMPFTCSFVGWTTYSNTSTSSRVCQGVQQIVYKVLFDDVHNLFATKIALENAHCSTQLAALPGPPNGHYQIRNSQAWQIFSGITSWALERTWHFKQWFRSAAVEQLKSGSRRAQIFVAWWSGGGDWAREIAVVTIQIGARDVSLIGALLNCRSIVQSWVEVIEIAPLCRKLQTGRKPRRFGRVEWFTWVVLMHATVAGCWCALAPSKASCLSHKWIVPAYQKVLAGHCSRKL